VAQVRTDVAVCDLTYTESAEHSLVLFSLVFLELVNSHVSMLDGDEVDKFAVVLDGVVRSLDVGLQGQLRGVLGVLALEEVLETGLTHLEFVKFGLVLTSFLFACHLTAHHVLTTSEGGEETLHVKLLSLEPDVSISEGVVHLVESIDNLLLDVADSRVGHGALGHITVTVVVNCDVLVLHEGIIHSQVVVLEFVLVALHLLDVVLGFLHHDIRLLQESRERVDLLSVLGNLGGVLVLVNLEVESEFLEDLHRLLLGEGQKLFVNLTGVTSKDLEFLAFN